MYAQTNYENINKLIKTGDYTKASQEIDIVIQEGGLTDSARLELEFQKERMERIRKDFRKTEEDILKYIRRYYPEAGIEDLKKWEDDGTLEFKLIDGEKFYFNRSHANLFRVNKEAKARKNEIDGVQKSKLNRFIEEYIPGVIEEAAASGKKVLMPQRMKLKYKLVVDADVVPEGETIRCWLPYPQESHDRQQNIELISVNCGDYIIAPEDRLHRTIYLERKSVKGEPTVFEFELKYTAYNEWHNLYKTHMADYNKESELYKEFTSERPPHIIFTDKVKKLSAEIIKDSDDPFIKAKKIFKWIHDNIPWAGAREYSTISNISDYCISNGWGDCGIKALTFITLCRYNGIPAKWQSGWMLHPGSINLHDWAEIYAEGTGWVPVDPDFNFIDSENEDVKWFYFGGIDAYHFIVNDDYSRALYPAKIYPRSETVDFQRGEVEWRGGNLYFDKWDYFMNVDYLD
jgi:hypothetical protein